MGAEPDRVLIEQAIAKDRRAVRALLDVLAPVVQSRVARILLRRSAAQLRDVREEVKDLTQHVFSVLFVDGGRVLLQWDPERGLSLVNYVGLIAEREVRTVLRSRRKSPWTEEPLAPEDFEQSPDSDQGPEQIVASREAIAAVRDAVRAQLTDHGLELFEWIVVEGRSVEEVCALSGKTPDAIYAWRSRLSRLVLKVAAEVMSDSAAQRRRPEDAQL